MLGVMLERFLQAYQPAGDSRLPPESDQTPGSLRKVGGGLSFGGGLYRLHTDPSAEAMQEHLRIAFPGAPRHTRPYGYDWLGRQFCATANDASATSLMFEPGTGEVLEIPVPFADIHDQEFVEYGDAALASDFFGAYLATGAPPPGVSECVGYLTPLFLGGADIVANLEMIDMDVYWHLMSQLIRHAAGLSVGTPIARGDRG
jgi:hypothetical protein